MDCEICIGTVELGNGKYRRCRKKALCKIGCDKFCKEHVHDVVGGKYIEGTDGNEPKCIEPPGLKGINIKKTLFLNKNRVQEKYLTRNPPRIDHQPPDDYTCTIRALKMYHVPSEYSFKEKGSKITNVKFKNLYKALNDRFQPNSPSFKGINLNNFFETVERYLHVDHLLVATLIPKSLARKKLRQVDESYFKKPFDGQYRLSSVKQLQEALNMMTPNRYFLEVGDTSWNHVCVIKRRVKHGQWMVHDGLRDRETDAVSLLGNNNYFYRIHAIVPKTTKGVPRNLDRRLSDCHDCFISTLCAFSDSSREGRIRSALRILGERKNPSEVLYIKKIFDAVQRSLSMYHVMIAVVAPMHLRRQYAKYDHHDIDRFMSHEGKYKQNNVVARVQTMAALEKALNLYSTTMEYFVHIMNPEKYSPYNHIGVIKRTNGKRWMLLDEMMKNEKERSLLLRDASPDIMIRVFALLPLTSN